MNLDRRSVIAGAAALGLLPVLPAAAQETETWEQRWQRGLREDWPGLRRYAADNLALIAANVRTDIVFMGDSITEGWRDKRPAFFKPGRVGRGIGGQTTGQMVLRMLQDVVQLRPRFVHIMAGTNDIAGNTGPMTVAQTEDNLRAMILLAKASGIEVLLASVPPADGFPWRPGLETVAPIREINAWAAGYAMQAGVTWIDYTPVLADASGAMKPGMAYDGVHPTGAGYDAMASALEPLLAERGI